MDEFLSREQQDNLINLAQRSVDGVTLIDKSTLQATVDESIREVNGSQQGDEFLKPTDSEDEENESSYEEVNHESFIKDEEKWVTPSTSKRPHSLTPGSPVPAKQRDTKDTPPLSKDPDAQFEFQGSKEGNKKKRGPKEKHPSDDEDDDDHGLRRLINMSLEEKDNRFVVVEEIHLQSYPVGSRETVYNVIKKVIAAVRANNEVPFFTHRVNQIVSILKQEESIPGQEMISDWDINEDSPVASGVNKVKEKQPQPEKEDPPPLKTFVRNRPPEPTTIIEKLDDLADELEKGIMFKRSGNPKSTILVNLETLAITKQDARKAINGITERINQLKAIFSLTKEGIFIYNIVSLK